MRMNEDCDDGSAAAFGWHDGGYGMTSAFSLFVSIGIGADDERPCEWWWWWGGGCAVPMDILMA